jgi:hypothetical protein
MSRRKSRILTARRSVSMPCLVTGKGNGRSRVRANWRITFRFDCGEPGEFDFTDYH